MKYRLPGICWLFVILVGLIKEWYDIVISNYKAEILIDSTLDLSANVAGILLAVAMVRLCQSLLKKKD